MSKYLRKGVNPWEEGVGWEGVTGIGPASTVLLSCPLYLTPSRFQHEDSRNQGIIGEASPTGRWETPTHSRSNAANLDQSYALSGTKRWTGDAMDAQWSP